MEGDAGAAYEDGEALPDGEGQYMEGEEGEGGERYYDEEVRAGPWAIGFRCCKQHEGNWLGGLRLLQVGTEPH